MELNQQAKNFLHEAAKWATFLSIIGFIGIGLMIIISFSMGTILSQIPNDALGGLPIQFFSLFYLILAGVSFIPIYFLFQFGNNIKNAIKNNDTDLLTFGLKKLKSHYKFIGILTVILMSLNLLFIIFGAFTAML